MAHYPLSTIAEIIGAPFTGGADWIIDTLLIDSRSRALSPATSLFFALSTAAGDGHAYIPEMLDKGVKAFVVSRPVEGLPADAVQLIVPDTLAALQTLAGEHRRRCKDVTVIGITGSRGKTVVKEWLAQLLAPDYAAVSRSPRSFNSQIGVPLSLWSIEAAAEGKSLAIIEAGVSQQGEMDALEEIIRPDIAVITCLTDEHAAGFPSATAKLAEKQKLGRRAKTVVGPVDVATLPWQEADKEVCLLVMKAMGYSAEVIDSRMAALPEPADTRLEVIDSAGGGSMVLDTFTCDCRSLPGALEFMRRRLTPGSEMAAIIGDIDNPAEAKKLLGAYGISNIVTIGTEGATYPTVDAFLADPMRPSFAGFMTLLKGAPGQGFGRIAEKLERKQHETVLEVNLDALDRNYTLFRSMLKPSTGLVAMVKAFGYGAGSVELARTLQARGAAYLAVAAHDEGVELRRAGITMPIMVLNPRVSDYAALFEYKLEPEIYSLPLLRDIIAEARRRRLTDYPVHIKLDTGMHRLGFLLEELDDVAAVLRESPQVKAATVFSHLCCADDPAEDDYTQGQFRYFDACCERLRAGLGYDFKRHILNTAGIVRFPERQYDLARLGIGLYGLRILPPALQPPVERVTSLRSVIIALRRWPAGTTIGYNRRGRLERESLIATVPIGYADGLDRHLGYGNHRVMVGSTPCPTVGSICMDVMMIDVTDAHPEPRVGDRVEIFGDDVATEMMADTLSTIPYEVQTAVASRVKRVYFRE